MQRLMMAFRSFFKAWKKPEEATKFLQGPKEVTSKEALASSEKPTSDTAHLRLLAALQEEGRFLDFLKEDISSFSDEEVGASVRKIHKDCQQVIEKLVTVRPVLQEDEGSKIHIPVGYNSSSIKVVGFVKGEPPFEGILIHKGWRADKRSLPKKYVESSQVIYPAEVEIKR